VKFLLMFLLFQLLKGADLRRPKFSLFSVISFENNDCTVQGDDTMKGTCHTAEECTEFGGISRGNCASGFGTCCVFFARTCGQSVIRNSTYLVNPDHPGTNPELGVTCEYDVNTEAFPDTICQIRLDFDTVQTVAPILAIDGANGIGSCTSDTIAFTSPSGKNPPTYCGDISGTHMYIETARANPTGATVTVTTGQTAFDRLWRIKVGYIDCFATRRAPTDCLQYFTGIAGNVMSFGWTAQQVLTLNQAYTSCFRQEIGFCAIEFSVSNSGLTPDFFSLSAAAAVGAKRGAGPCNIASVMFTAAMEVQKNTGVDATNYYCGGQFNIMSGAMESGVVRSDALPFELRTIVVNNGVIVATNVGFNINYRQIAC